MTRKAISTTLVSGDRLFSRRRSSSCRRGLGIEIVGEAGTLADLADRIDAAPASEMLLLLGWNTGEEAFHETFQRVRGGVGPTRGLIVLADNTDPALSGMTRSGPASTACCTRNMSSEALVHAIMLVMLGEEGGPGPSWRRA